jgi:hypothetical protein
MSAFSILDQGPDSETLTLFQPAPGLLLGAAEHDVFVPAEAASLSTVYHGDARHFWKFRWGTQRLYPRSATHP